VTAGRRAQYRRRLATPAMTPLGGPVMTPLGGPSNDAAWRASNDAAWLTQHLRCLSAKPIYIRLFNLTQRNIFIIFNNFNML